MRPLPLLLILAACGEPTPRPDRPAWTGWDAPPSGERVPVRVVTWNVEDLGQEGSDEWSATRDVLARLDADVVGLNEVAPGVSAAVAALADALGYDVALAPPTQPFGDDGNAILSRLPEVSHAFETSASLSGDDDANDVTRLPAVLTVTLPDGAGTLAVVSQHWKSGFEVADGFRRAVDGVRTAQAAASVLDADFVVAMGDVNAEAAEFPAEPAVWDAVPDGMPASYRLGSDLDALRVASGIPNDPYAEMAALGLLPVAVAQRDGDLATRPESGRRLDNLFTSASVRTSTLSGEIFDCQDDAIGLPGLAGAGDPVAADTCVRAADHLPVVLEFRARTSP